jgi:signal transduction histidine kinase
MRPEFRSGSFWQTALVWLLFLGSIATLFVNSLTAWLLPGQELQIRDTLGAAARKVAAASLPEADRLPPEFTTLPAGLHRKLERITEEVLQAYPGVEGGFYINQHHDEFAGYAFPTGPVHGPRHEKRRDPPPREEPYIRVQAEQCASQESADPLIQGRDVGPSRVVVATLPVGSQRPAHLVVWLMYRLTGPEEHRAQARRYLISTSLALAGIVAALLLTLGLRRTLSRERASRERLREELRRSEHLASLGLLVAQVAHEVRNPLAGIRSTVQLWQRLPGESQTPESMQAVVTAVDRLDELLTSLLQFSRAEGHDQQPVDINAVVRESLELLRAQATQQHVLLELNLDPQVPTILGSAKALRQVVLNLATNALQAMPHSGRLTCRTRSAADAVECEIADTGPGIDPNVRSRLFEPFFTTRTQGTGLGLALCREIVLQHNGRIELESVEPHGTLCRVVLPVHRGIS